MNFDKLLFSFTLFISFITQYSPIFSNIYQYLPIFTQYLPLYYYYHYFILFCATIILYYSVLLWRTFQSMMEFFPIFPILLITKIFHVLSVWHWNHKKLVLFKGNFQTGILLDSDSAWKNSIIVETLDRRLAIGIPDSGTL